MAKKHSKAAKVEQQLEVRKSALKKATQEARPERAASTSTTASSRSSQTLRRVRGKTQDTPSVYVYRTPSKATSAINSPETALVPVAKKDHDFKKGADPKPTKRASTEPEAGGKASKPDAPKKKSKIDKDKEDDDHSDFDQGLNDLLADTEDEAGSADESEAQDDDQADNMSDASTMELPGLPSSEEDEESESEDGDQIDPEVEPSSEEEEEPQSDDSSDEKGEIHAKKEEKKKKRLALEDVNKKSDKPKKSDTKKTEKNSKEKTETNAKEKTEKNAKEKKEKDTKEKKKETKDHTDKNASTQNAKEKKKDNTTKNASGKTEETKGGAISIMAKKAEGKANSMTHKREWATFSRQLEDRKKLPVQLAPYVNTKKLDMFQIWLENNQNLEESHPQLFVPNM